MSHIVDETRETLAGRWSGRFASDTWEIAWSESPPVRYRLFISNDRMRTTDQLRRRVVTLDSTTIEFAHMRVLF
jgi:hypothetical protein